MKKITSLFVLVNFIVSCIMPPHGMAQTLTAVGLMPQPGMQVSLSPVFTPAHLRGMVINPSDPFKFDFIVNRGDEALTDAQKQEEYSRLVKYFLAALAVPDTDQWVNLSPYEKDRIITDGFGLTEMGRDLLAQDYLLKQISASLTNPDTDLGKKFWSGVYEQAYQKYGTTDIPTDTFNKVWITPDKAVVYEKGNSVIVLEQHLKVMLESDYKAMKENAVSEVADNDAVKISKQVMRDVILPAIEKEVNEGKGFAPLRQVYSGMLLATWYKVALKESILGKLYADKGKVKGVDQDPKNNQQIYDQYVQAFKKGVFNMIKEDVDRYSQEVIPRKYFSGGAVNVFAGILSRINALPTGTVRVEEILKDDEVVAIKLVNTGADADAFKALVQGLPTEKVAHLEDGSIRVDAAMNYTQGKEALTALLKESPESLNRLATTTQNVPSLIAFIDGELETVADSVRGELVSIREQLQSFDKREWYEARRHLPGMPQIKPAGWTYQKPFGVDYAMSDSQRERVKAAGIDVKEERDGFVSLEINLQADEISGMTGQKALEKFASAVGWAKEGMAVKAGSFKVSGTKAAVELYIDAAMNYTQGKEALTAILKESPESLNRLATTTQNVPSLIAFIDAELEVATEHVRGQLVSIREQLQSFDKREWYEQRRHLPGMPQIKPAGWTYQKPFGVDYAMSDSQRERVKAAGIDVKEERDGFVSLEINLQADEISGMTGQKALEKFASAVGWAKEGMAVKAGSFKVSGTKAAVELYMDAAMKVSEKFASELKTFLEPKSYGDYFAPIRESFSGVLDQLQQAFPEYMNETPFAGIESLAYLYAKFMTQKTGDALPRIIQAMQTKGTNYTEQGKGWEFYQDLRQAFIADLYYTAANQSGPTFNEDSSREAIFEIINRVDRNGHWGRVTELAAQLDGVRQEPSVKDFLAKLLEYTRKNDAEHLTWRLDIQATVPQILAVAIAKFSGKAIVRDGVDLTTAIDTLKSLNERAVELGKKSSQPQEVDALRQDMIDAYDRIFVAGSAVGIGGKDWMGVSSSIWNNLLALYALQNPNFDVLKDVDFGGPTIKPGATEAVKQTITTRLSTQDAELQLIAFEGSEQGSRFTSRFSGKDQETATDVAVELIRELSEKPLDYKVFGTTFTKGDLTASPELVLTNMIDRVGRVEISTFIQIVFLRTIGQTKRPTFDSAQGTVVAQRSFVENGVLFQGQLVSKEEDGKVQYYFTFGFNAPGNIAYAPSSGVKINEYPLGDNEDFARQVLYTMSGGTAWYLNLRTNDGEGQKAIAGIIDQVKENLGKGIRQYKYGEKLTSVEGLIDNEFESGAISPSYQATFIQALTALSAILADETTAKAVIAALKDMVFTRLRGQQYPDVFWSSTIPALAPVIRNADDIRTVGERAIRENRWRGGFGPDNVRFAVQEERAGRPTPKATSKMTLEEKTTIANQVIPVLSQMSQFIGKKVLLQFNYGVGVEAYHFFVGSGVLNISTKEGFDEDSIHLKIALDDRDVGVTITRRAGVWSVLGNITPITVQEMTAEAKVVQASDVSAELTSYLNTLDATYRTWLAVGVKVALERLSSLDPAKTRLANVTLSDMFNGQPFNHQEYRKLIEGYLSRAGVTDANTMLLLSHDGTRDSLSKRFGAEQTDLFMKGIQNYLTDLSKTLTVDAAAAVDNAALRGGIDFAQSNLDMQIKRDGAGVPLPISQQNFDNIHIDGLVPVILNIRPAAGAPVLSQIATAGSSAA